MFSLRNVHFNPDYVLRFLHRTYVKVVRTVQLSGIFQQKRFSQRLLSLSYESSRDGIVIHIRRRFHEEGFSPGFEIS